ncbi:MAG: hypothetical protein ACTTJK_01580 [Phocaeicola sp.]|uniref:hypothetical protein n=1 Tax=Phocaeicola sp. TaxID=2773926 RepID=UPI003F9F28A7
MKASRYIGCVFVLMMVFTSCRYYIAMPDKEQEIPKHTLDSLNYLTKYHYTLNTNFEVTSDSLMLQQLPLIDVIPVYKHDKLVVAEFMTTPGDSVDSVWVKVAHDQNVMGWVHRKELMEKVVPTDAISHFIHFFSHSRGIASAVIFVVFGLFFIYRAVKKEQLRFVWFNDIDSIFPTLLTMLVALSATLYAGMQRFVPGTWEQFYYAPSLNPFHVPLILGLFLCAVWALLIVAIATVDDVFRQAKMNTALFYLLGLVCVCIILYFFFTYTTYIYIGYAFLIAYYVWAIHHLCRSSYQYICGSCGAKLKHKGICPHCGAFNE